MILSGITCNLELVFHELVYAYIGVELLQTWLVQWINHIFVKISQPEILL